MPGKPTGRSALGLELLRAQSAVRDDLVSEPQGLLSVSRSSTYYRSNEQTVELTLEIASGLQDASGSSFLIISGFSVRAEGKKPP